MFSIAERAVPRYALWLALHEAGLDAETVRRAVFGPLGRWYPKLDRAPRFLRAKTTFQALARDSVEAYLHGVGICPREMRRQGITADYLRGPRSAAGQQVARLLRQAYGYDVTLLENATRSGVLGALAKFRQTLTAGDVRSPLVQGEDRAVEVAAPSRDRLRRRQLHLCDRRGPALRA